MRKVTLILLPAFLMLLLPGCGGAPTYDSVMNEMLVSLNQMCDVLESGADEETMKSQMESIQAKMEELKKQAEALGEPSEAEQKRLEEKYGEKMQATMGRFMQAVMKAGGNINPADFMPKM